MAGEVLCDSEIKELIVNGAIKNADANLVNPSSLDLRLGKQARRLLGCGLPMHGQMIEALLLNKEYVDTVVEDIGHRFYLEANQLYLFNLVESLELPKGISARVFNKSGRGRIGTSVRTICDGMPYFDNVPQMYGGHLFAEVSATAFPELITPGETAMPQIRFYDGTPEALKGLALKVLLEQDPVLLDKNGKPIEFSRKDLDNICDSGVLSFSADFSGEFLAYRARKERKNIDLSKKDEYLPEDFFEEVKPKGKERSLVVHPGDFYLIHSMERIRLNPRMAAEIAEHSTELGDMKSHYAGLINCGHGYEQGKLTGANIVFEVRARDSPILIQHGQKIALFNLYKMSKAPEIKYSQVQSTGFYCLASILPTQFKKKEKKE